MIVIRIFNSFSFCIFLELIIYIFHLKSIKVYLNYYSLIDFTYESFLHARVSNFNENPDPKIRKNWLREIEERLPLLEVPQEIKVEVDTPFFVDKSTKWWE